MLCSRTGCLGIVLIAAAVAAATAGCERLSGPKFAQVVSVSEAQETVRTPREECEDVALQQQAPVQDQNRVAGSVIGGVVGGVLGHQIGGGTGKTVATVAGAAGGAYTGNKVQKGMQERDVVTKTERHCRTVEYTSERLVGYDVVYRLDGKEGSARLAFDPGKQIAVKDGQLVLTPPAQPTTK